MKFFQQVDHWLRDVGGAGSQQQAQAGDPNTRNQGAPKNRKDPQKPGDSRRPERSENLEELGERGDPAGTRNPEPPPVSSANAATRITGDLIILSPCYHYHFNHHIHHHHLNHLHHLHNLHYLHHHHQRDLYAHHHHHHHDYD